MKITRVSIITGIERTRDIDITPEQWDDYVDGALIQNAMPNLSPTDREFIISGMTDFEWQNWYCEGSEKGDEDGTEDTEL